MNLAKPLAYLVVMGRNELNFMAESLSHGDNPYFKGSADSFLSMARTSANLTPLHLAGPLLSWP